MMLVAWWVVAFVSVADATFSFNFQFGAKQAPPLLTDFIANGLKPKQQIFLQPAPSSTAVYNFIIVGAGPAGCVLANRLTENPNIKVLLLEAGEPENFLHRVPALAAFLQGTSSNWNYRSVPQTRACFGMNNNECALPRGKVMGGTSTINYMIYNRGNRRDFDRWAEFGNPGWAYQDVLPYFLKSERANLRGLENSPYHNHTGPLSVEDVPFRTRMVHSFIKSAKQAGHKQTDYNGESQLGVSYVQATTIRGRRHSAASAYIDPIRHRPNLDVLMFAHVTKVLIDKTTKRAYGVQYIQNGFTHKARARDEVILSAGTFNSPQLLMLSGVGPADNLNAIGVPIVKELPVGKVMYDHMCHFGPTFTLNTTGDSPYVKQLRLGDFKSYLTQQPSRLNVIGGVEALTFVKVPRSTEPADFPDIELITVLGSFASDHGTALKQGANIRDEIYQKVYRPLDLARRDHYSNLIMQFHPKSYGRVWLHDRNPLRPPKIDPKYFINTDDIETLLEGIKSAIKIAEQPALRRIGARLHDIPLPGCEQHKFNSDDYWRCSIRTMSYTLHHQVATCRMGPATNPTTVVNHELKVHGVTRLRVADTSIIPFPPTAHTNAASFMIGEKAADMIKAEYGY